MSNTKNYQQICDEFYNFKNSFGNIFYLMKLFHFLYFEINEMELYPEEDTYMAQNCLCTLSDTINELLEKNYKQLIILYKEFEDLK